MVNSTQSKFSFSQMCLSTPCDKSVFKPRVIIVNSSGSSVLSYDVVLLDCSSLVEGNSCGGPINRASIGRRRSDPSLGENHQAFSHSLVTLHAPDRGKTPGDETTRTVPFGRLSNGGLRSLFNYHEHLLSFSFSDRMT